MVKKLLFITRFMSGGGAERVISVLSSELVQQGYEVGILIYNATENDYEIAPTVDIFTMGDDYDESKGCFITRKAYRQKRMRKIVNSYKPDVIIPFLKPIVVETYYFVTSLGIPIIATVRNLPQFSGSADRILYMYAVAHCSAIFLQTEAQKQNFNEKIQERAFVVPNPVNKVFLEVGATRTYNLDKRRSKIVVSAGRLDKQKNQKLLIDAMISVHKKYSDWILNIFGEGQERKKLDAYIQKHKAEEYIFLKGRTICLAEEYEKSDIFVLSSDFEGMPNALLEAMAAGMACVSTNCPTGPASLIGDNIYGRLTPVGDSNLLATNILYFIENHGNAVSCGEKAHYYIRDNFSPDKITGRLMENIGRFIKKG